MPKQIRTRKPYLKISIRTRRLIIRPFLLTDFSVCQASHQNRKILQHEFDAPMAIASLNNYARFKKKVERHRETGRLREHYVLGIFEKKSGALVGEADLFLINKKLRWANLGYHIQNQFWGKGYASEACKSVVVYAFKSLAMHRIEAAMDLGNFASMRVAEKIGMVREGSRRNFFPDEEAGEMHVFGANAMGGLG